MRLAGVSTIDQANEVLRDFLPRFNRQFGVPPTQPGSAYRQLPPSTCLDAVLCFKYIRTVANDNTVRFEGTTIQLLPDGHRASYARANVHVQERLDGSIVVAYQGRTLAAVPAPDALSSSGHGTAADPTAICPQTWQPPTTMALSRALPTLSAGTERRPSRATHLDHKPPNAPAPQEDQHQTTPGGECD